MDSKTVATSVMMISDTHGYQFNGDEMPSAQVLIHCGDMTTCGGLSELRDCVTMMGTIDAELKLVIAGNHDLSLDKSHRIENYPGEVFQSEDEYLKGHEAALDIMTGAVAKAAGVTYLQEGTHTFTLSNGARFTVYATPYTPKFGDWAFSYEEHEDRFNDASQVARNRTSIAANPIPSGVDIVISHGPPYSLLDECDYGNVGCPNLLRAVSRARPLLHCFGHVHEGHGANLVTWKPDGSVKNPKSATPLETEQVNEYPYTNYWPVQRGKQTLMVNAATVVNTASGLRPHNRPFIVELNLPRQ